MKILIIVCLLTFSFQIKAQQLIDKEGTTTFFSEAPLEDIEATNKKCLGAIDLNTGEIASSMKMKEFEFDKSLMQEHFNENYMESEKYPTATFSGKIPNFDKSKFEKDGVLELPVSGNITIHGVTKPLETTVKFAISGSKITTSTKFSVETADFKIKIPKIVISNIAEVIDITSQFQFELP